MFVHLHVHSDNSILDGVIKIDRIVKKAKSYGMPAVALTDNSNMYGVISFWQKCNAENIKPILGVDLNLAPRSRFDKQYKIDNRTTSLVLLAKNLNGYKNLIKLISIAHLEGFYYKPRVDIESLKNYSDGLIALSGGHRGELYRLISLGQYEDAYSFASTLKDIYGDDFYIELTRLGIKEEEIAESELFKISQKLEIPVVATNDVFYESGEDADAREVLWCIDDGRLLKDPSRKKPASDQNYFKSSQEMEDLFKDIPEVLENTLVIQDKIENFNISYGKVQPRYPKIPEDETEQTFLKKIVFENAPKVFGQLTREIEERLNYELEIIHNKGYDGYFLVVWDVANWARENGISVSARGSAAGACVAYVLGITNVDPIKWGLYFERFLNPERKSFPDIDLDIADDKRDEVIAYVKQNYGEHCVINVGALGKLSTKAAIRDVGRVLGIELKLIDRLSKLVPVKFGRVVGINAMIADEIAGKDLKVIEEERESVQEFRTLIREDGNDLREVRFCESCKSVFFDNDADTCNSCGSDLKVILEASERFVKLLKYVRKIENCVRNFTTHACGYLITSPNPVTEYVAVQKESGNRDRVVTQVEGKYLEDIGLMKFDFLGLANLSIIDNAVKLIKSRKDKNFSIESIPVDDSKTFNLLKRGDTKAVFQLESQGMRKYLTELKPDNLEEICAMLALYRPGPLQYIPAYINRKFGREKTEYLIPELEPIMKLTYGIPVYQEQILQIANKLAGYSLGAADNLRRAIGKKLPEAMAAEEKKFKEGFLSNFPQYSQEIADKLWEYAIPFADYGFNKSHSAAYAMISYRSAFIKANYPTEFFVSLMLSNIDNLDKLKRDITDAKIHGIKFLPPDINKSDVFFRIEEDFVIRFGIGGLKGVGVKTIQSIVEERNANGDFSSLDDLCLRINHKTVPKGAIELLIKIGALDSFGTRNALLSVLDEVYEKSKKIAQVQRSANSYDLFGGTTNSQECITKLPDVEEFDDEQKMIWEEEILGVIVSTGILDEVEKFSKSQGLSSISNMVNLDDSDGQTTKEEIRFKSICFVKDITVRNTKNSGEMALLSIMDSTGFAEAIVFPRLYATLKTRLTKGIYVKIDGVFKRSSSRIFVDNVEVYTKQDLLKKIDSWYRTRKRVDNSRIIGIELYIDGSTNMSVLKDLSSTLKSKRLEHDSNGVVIYIVIQNSDGSTKRIKLDGLYDSSVLDLVSSKFKLEYSVNRM